ncbi:MAG: (Fe-S)-binding protein [candidate division KSB1 bacterium]|nr:(Fe-S)-binding protein [candidate division KSB1 bacterium]
MNQVPTREIFLHFPLWMQLVFYAVAAVASFIFLFGFFRRFQKYRRGRKVNRFDHLGKRITRALAVIAAQSTVRKRDPFAGFAHFLIFWGFTFLFIGTTIVAIDHDILRFFDVSILKGTFYLGFSFVLDIWGVLFLIGLVLMAIRRYVVKPTQLDYSRPDDQNGKYDRSGFMTDDMLFLLLLFVIGVTGFLIEGLRIAETMPEFERWSPVGWWLAGMFQSMDVSSILAWHKWMWWVHAVVVMVFIGYIPYSKVMHIFTDTANLIFYDDMAARRLPPLPEPEPTEGKKNALPPMGYTYITDFTWKELLDFDACTKCGRCHAACPANAAGTTLSPRDLILDLRTFANEVLTPKEWFKQKFLKGSKWPLANGKSSEDALKVDVPLNVIRPETLWSCTTCMACVESCPVGIEHLTSIVQMRRHLVDLGELDDNLQNALMSLGDYGNSFGQSPKTRAKWTKGLSFKIKDARKEKVEYLWYVGDFASFDPRLQKVSQKVAEVMHAAGLDFGILYDAEKTAGNDVRRVGEEGLFEMLVEDNMATLKKAKFQKIFTTDPHTLNTLRNEYPEFGVEYPVEHYTSLLLSLIQSGKLPIKKKLGYKVTYHDPCYLARYNRVINAPREVMKAIGLELHEMPRCGVNTFCCGAGGGRIWMDTSNEKKRTSEQRIEEALSLGDIQYFITCCPKDYTMYTDAVKASGNEDRIEVKDLIEFVAEALDLQPAEKAEAAS